jgi:hypothetical protein
VLPVVLHSVVLTGKGECAGGSALAAVPCGGAFEAEGTKEVPAGSGGVNWPLVEEEPLF